jgi:hypothetical protein
MIRKSGYRFPLRQTRSVCAEIMGKQAERDDDRKKSPHALARLLATGMIQGGLILLARCRCPIDAPARLRLASLEVFTERKFQPLLPLFFRRRPALAFASVPCVLHAGFVRTCHRCSIDPQPRPCTQPIGQFGYLPSTSGRFARGGPPIGALSGHRRQNLGVQPVKPAARPTRAANWGRSRLPGGELEPDRSDRRSRQGRALSVLIESEPGASFLF